jgi:hypothetical protein
MQYRQSSFILALVLVVLPVYASSAASIDDLLGRTHLQASPRFIYGLQYDDNIDYDQSGKDRISDWSNSYRPGITLDAISPQFSLKSEADIRIREYINEKDFNSVDQNYQLALGYRPNDRWEYSLGGGYRVDVSTNRFEDGAALTDPFEFDRYKEKTWDYFGGFSYIITPRSTISLTGTFSNYDSGTTDDSNFYGVVASYRYSLGPRTELLVNGTYFYYDFKGNGEPNEDDDPYFFSDYDYTIKNYSFLTGITHSFLSGYELTVKGGFRHTKNDSTQRIQNPTPPPTINKEKSSGSGDGWTGIVELEKTYNDFTFRFEGSQDITVTPQGSNYDSTRLRLETTYRINPRFDANLLLRWFKAYASSSDDEFIGNSRDDNTYLIQTYVDYRLYRWLQIRAGHSLSLSDRKQDDKRSYHRNIVYINFIFTPLRKLVIR